MRQRGALLMLVLAAAACDGRPGTSHSFELVEVATYGSFAALDEDLSPDTTGLGGAVLADVAGLVKADGELFVLDRDWRKVVSFDRPGQEGRVVVGGFGEGPGEFRLPIDLTEAEPSGLSVLDYELGRVTLLRPQEPARVVRLHWARPFGHVIVGDRIFVTHPLGDPDSSPIVEVLDTAGATVEGTPTLPENERPFGLPLALTRDGEGAVLVSSTRPGMWIEWRQGRWEWIGAPLFPDVAPPREELEQEGVIRVIPSQVQTAGIAVSRDDLVLQGYVELPEGWDRSTRLSREDIRQHLALFERDGQHLGTLALPTGTDLSCLAAHDDSVFVCRLEPVPHVVEYRLDGGR